jgi:hypothetical protein
VCAFSQPFAGHSRHLGLANRAAGCPIPRQGLPQSESSSTCVLNGLGHGLARVIPPPHHHERRNDGDAREMGSSKMVQRRVNATEDNRRASLPGEGTDFVAAKRVAGVNPDAYDVARLHAGNTERL